MKIFVATDAGHSPNTMGEPILIEGELLFPAEQCDKAHCMCRREFVGITTGGRTMQARVVELEMIEEQVRDIARGYVREMFGDGYEGPDALSDEDFEEEVDGYVQDIIEPPTAWEVGTIVERWGYELRDIRDNNLPHD